MLCRLEEETNYLLEKISRMGSQRLDINSICQNLEVIVTAHPANLQDVVEHHRSVYTQVRERLKVAGLDILIALISKL